MPGEMDTDRQTIRIDGAEPVVLPWDVDPDGLPFETIRGPLAFECASGDRIERDYTGIDVLDVLDAAAVPPETTHVQFETIDGDVACIPLPDLDGAILALGDGSGTTPERPRFVSPHVLGPRTVKQVCRIRPLALPAAADREDHETLPLDN